MKENDQKVVFSSSSVEWETPKDLFEELDLVYTFDLDPCATKENAKCEVFFTKEIDGLSIDWSIYGTCAFVNPPYGRGVTGKWIKKCAEEANKGLRVVALVPARTDTRWFHDYVYKKPRVEIRFIKGRLKFGESKDSAPFPSMVIEFRPFKPIKEV